MPRVFPPNRLILTLVLMGSATVVAQSVAIDATRSTVTVKVFKAGLLSGFAHDHTIQAPIASGSIDAQQRSVVLSFQAADLKLMDSEGSESDHREIQATMMGPKVLDANRFPIISFRSKQVQLAGAGHYEADGYLSLHGVTREVTIPVVLSNGLYRGEIKLKQTDFGIMPVKIAGGAVRVKDVIEVKFEIATR